MTTGPLSLLLPTSPQRGRRALGALASMLGHAVLLIVLGVFRGPSGDVQGPVALPEKKQIVWVAPMPPSAPRVEPPVTKAAAPAAASKPIAYAAAPTSVRSGRDWRELLPRALALQAQGLNAPSFVIENLDVPLVATLATRGLALIIAGRPPFDQDARGVHWTGTGPTDVGVLPVAWTQRVARRAIILPREWVGTLPLMAGEQVYLLISTELDAAILAAQLAAAEQRGVPLSALVRTRGRLLPTTEGLLAFHVDAVDLHS